jgi:hypothetical protein
MNQYATHRNARVDLTSTGAVFCSPVVFEFEGKNGTNSTETSGETGGAIIARITPKIQTIAPAINPPFVGCSLSKMDN